MSFEEYIDKRNLILAYWFKNTDTTNLISSIDYFVSHHSQLLSIVQMYLDYFRRKVDV